MQCLNSRCCPSRSFGGFFSPPNPTPENLVEFARTRSEVAVLRLMNEFGMCSYLVSPEGAEKLLAEVFPLDTGRGSVLP